MTSTRASGFNHRCERLRNVTSIVFAGIVFAVGCAPEPTVPQGHERPKIGASSRVLLIQDEDLVPNGDDSNPGVWEPFVNYWSVLDDIDNDDTDYIFRNRLGLPPTTNAITVNLSNPVTEPSPSQVHTIKVRWKVVGNYSTLTPQATGLIFFLYSGTTLIAQGSGAPSSSYVTLSKVLTQGEVNSIFGYNDLKIKLQANLKPATENDQIQARITSVRLEIR